MAKGSGTPVWTSGYQGLFWRAAAAASLSLAVSSGTAKDETRTLEIFNIHTKETTRVTFKTDGRYVDEGLKKLNYAMRDWRLDIVTKMDPKLFDLLWDLKNELGAKKPIHLISGHRSQKTNNMLRRTRGGQAKKSLHIRGRAADVYFPDVSLKRVRNAALVKQRGGVGYYPRSGQPFVHVDTGRVRHWPRIPSTQLAAILKRGVPKVPVRRVQETVVAAIDAPAPQSKPRSALENVPAPITLAALDQKPVATANVAGAPQLDEPSSEAPDQVRSREWGESWLAPSRPRAQSQHRPRSKPSRRPILVADLSPSAARSHTKRLSTSLAPSMTGYADPGRPVAGGGGLLDGTNTPLAGMLADAERLSALASLGVDAARPEDQGANLADAVAEAPEAEAPKAEANELTANPAVPASPAKLATRPIVTASLSPAAFLPLKREIENRFRAILFAPAHAHVFEPTPDIVETFSPSDGIDRGLDFAGALFSETEVGAFAPNSTELAYNPATLRVAEASERKTGGIIGYAKRMIAWIIGD